MRKYQERVNKGIELLDRVFRKRWLAWIDLDRLDMSEPDVLELGDCGCIGAQVALRSTRVRRADGSFPSLCGYPEFVGVIGLDDEDATECGLSLPWHLHGEYPGLTREWKRQIQERRAAA